MNELIKLVGVSKVYGRKAQVKALDNVKLTISQGEFLAIVGPSGAGKSTLLHVAAGLDRPGSGEVFFRGRSIYGLGDRELSALRNRSFGFVFQFYHLIEELTVLENILVGTGLSPVSTLRQPRDYPLKKAKELLKYLGLAQREAFFPSQLSGGEKQKAALARALINEGEIIFCDEPTGNLDHVSQDAVVGLLQELNSKNNKTIILVSHNLELAKEAKRIVRINDGVISN